MWVHRGVQGRVLTLVSAMLVSGCSFLFVKGPPKRPVEKAEKRVKCTNSRAAPVVDLLITGFQVYRTVAAAQATDAEYSSAPISRGADIAFGLGFMTLFGASTRRP